MKKIFIKSAYILALSMLLTAPGCSDDRDPEITSIEFNRVFSPLNFKGTISNNNSFSLKWDTDDKVSSYDVKIFKKENLEENLVYSTSLTGDELPLKISDLDYDTKYIVSIQAKSNVASLSDSKWVNYDIRTSYNDMIDDIEELPNSVVLLLKDNTQANQVIVKPGHITDYLITGIPGTIEQEVTTEEIAQGSITVNNLEANTKYSVQLMNGEVTCGYITITTTSDDVIVIYPGDDIKEIIENAPDSSNFLISQGTYHASSEIIINKSVSIKGISRQNFPNLHVSFQIYDEGDLDHKIDFALENLNLLAEKESGSAWDYIARLRTAEKEYGKMTFVNVFGTGYMKSIFSGQGVAKPLVDLLSFENCIFKDVISSGADCIDFRDGGTIKEVVLSKSSFINCATARDFLRLDDAASAYPTQATSINIDRCTFVGVSNSASRRMLYVRNQSTLSFTHNIVASTAGYFNNSANLVAEKFLNNNYFEADLFITDLSSEDKDAGKYRLIDNSDSFTLHDPMFKNPESGDYTVSNSNLNEIGSGETRW